MTHNNPRTPSIWLALWLSGILGCGPNPGGVRFEGAVTLNGLPVEQGFIRFHLQDSTRPAEVGAPIRDGQYCLTAALTEGRYRVEIEGYRPFSDMGDGPAPGSLGLAPGVEQFLPHKFNRNSILSVDVTLGAEPKLDFPLQSN